MSCPLMSLSRNHFTHWKITEPVIEGIYTRLWARMILSFRIQELIYHNCCAWKNSSKSVFFPPEWSAAKQSGPCVPCAPWGKAKSFKWDFDRGPSWVCLILLFVFIFQRKRVKYLYIHDIINTIKCIHIFQTNWHQPPGLLLVLLRFLLGASTYPPSTSMNILLGEACVEPHNPLDSWLLIH